MGGMFWRKEGVEKLKPLVEKALHKKKVLGDICDASVFLGKIGVLNNIKHTSNDINDLKDCAKEEYSGENNYLMEPAVRDNNVITLNKFIMSLVIIINLVISFSLKLMIIKGFIMQA